MKYQVPNTRLLLSALLLFLAACSPSLQTSNDDAAGVTLDVAPGTVAAGGEVELTLFNGSPDPIGYNLCSSGLEVREGGGWGAVPPDRVCTMELRTLEAGGRASYPITLPSGLEAGEYSFVTTVEHLEAGDRSGVRSDTFSVR